jgi:hypothetical protein
MAIVGNAYRSLVVKHKEKRPPKVIGVDGRYNMKLVVN